ncbi:MAG: guanylate kinase [Lysobacterales bacterium]
MSESRASLVFIVAAPSGAGKTSLVKALVEDSDDLLTSISHTTRQPRPGEVDGEHYHFIAEDTYQIMVEQGDFLEHAIVHGNGYGSSRSEMQRAQSLGADLILEIDWQGARQAKAQIPSARSVFILPPSRTELAKRLRRRAQDSDEVIARRLDGAVEEMRHWDEFDYVVVNDQFEVALAQLRSIVSACRSAGQAQSQQLSPLLDDLLGRQ